jgi:hypothetical protein
MEKIAASFFLSIAAVLLTVSSAAAALDVVLGPPAAPGPAPVSFCSLYTHFNCSTTCKKCISRCVDPSITNFSCGRAVNKTVIVTCTCGHLSPTPPTLVPSFPPSPPPTAPKSQPLTLTTPKSGSPAVEVACPIHYVLCAIVVISLKMEHSQVATSPFSLQPLTLLIRAFLLTVAVTLLNMYVT